MKTFQFVLLTIFSVFLFSCQDDDKNEIRVPISSLTNVAPLTSILSRVSQNPTTVDNILDGTSFCSVQLPVTIIVNYNRVVVSSEKDFALVASIIDEYSNDDDKINFIFPITMVFRNFSTQTINNEIELKKLLDSYGEYTDYTEIDCIDFNYPIGINSYDSNSQQAKSFTIFNNSQLYNFVNNLKDTDYFTLNFPITMTSSIDGKTIAVKKNSELESVIENEISKCEIPLNENKDLAIIISNGTWFVSYFSDDGKDKTFEFYGYNFIFSSNGSVTAVKNTTIKNGIWSSYTDDGIKKLDLSFSGDTLDELKDDWKVIEYNTTSIRLKHGNIDDLHYLYFTRKQ